MPGPNAAGMIRKIGKKEISDPIGTRTPYLPAYSIAPRSFTLPRALLQAPW
jgi:hypothetical protein